MLDVNLSGSRLTYNVSGTGPVVVALHSTASTARQWASLTAHLQQHYRVIAPNLPGYGGSDPRPDHGQGRLGTEADTIFALIERIGKPIHLVGHSYGAAVALKIAMKCPDAVRSLSIIEPALFHLLRDGDAGDRKLFSTIASVAGIVNAAAAEGNPWAGMARFVDFWNGPGTWQHTSHDLRNQLAGQTPQVINNFAASFAETWPAAACRKVNCPVLAVTGSKSQAPAKRVTEILAGTLPGLHHVIVPGADHMVPLTDPHIVDPLISGHLRAADIGHMHTPQLVQTSQLPEAA